MQRKKLELTEDKKRIINEIVSIIKKRLEINFPDYNKDFKLYTDASDIGIGSALTQDDKIIGLYSYKFNLAQTRYPTAEKEIFAILKSLQYFKSIIFNNKIMLFTDHKNF